MDNTQRMTGNGFDGENDTRMNLIIAAATEFVDGVLDQVYIILEISDHSILRLWTMAWLNEIMWSLIIDGSSEISLRGLIDGLIDEVVCYRTESIQFVWVCDFRRQPWQRQCSEHPANVALSCSSVWFCQRTCSSKYEVFSQRSGVSWRECDKYHQRRSGQWIMHPASNPAREASANRTNTDNTTLDRSLCIWKVLDVWKRGEKVGIWPEAGLAMGIKAKLFIGREAVKATRGWEEETMVSFAGNNENVRYVKREAAEPTLTKRKSFLSELWRWILSAGKTLFSCDVSGQRVLRWVTDE